ncbi:hypothetical protein GA565_10775 [Rouxiella sp. S1S-2]|nr:hypothetical protein GA565_10775 [Rouxiella sp. S1S-2]
MSGICSCNVRLDDSQYCIDSFGNTFKSCPRCSQISGHHVFYTTDEFGEKDMGDGRVLLQTYCPSCRSYKNRPLVPAFECK